MGLVKLCLKSTHFFSPKVSYPVCNLLDFFSIRSFYYSVPLTIPSPPSFPSTFYHNLFHNTDQDVGELSGPTDLLSSCERDFCFESASMTTSLALVPYDENRVMPHEKAVREFTLAGHVFTIKQDWNSLGVAAVVWDSVS